MIENRILRHVCAMKKNKKNDKTNPFPGNEKEDNLLQEIFKNR